MARTNTLTVTTLPEEELEGVTVSLWRRKIMDIGMEPWRGDTSDIRDVYDVNTTNLRKAEVTVEGKFSGGFVFEVNEARLIDLYNVAMAPFSERVDVFAVIKTGYNYFKATLWRDYLTSPWGAHVEFSANLVLYYPKGEVPPPPTVQPPPEEPTDWLSTMLNLLPWAVIGFVGLYALRLLPKPRREEEE